MRQTKPKRVLKGGRNLYARGAGLERRVKARLEKAGWSVTRAAGSRSPVDLVAAQYGVSGLLNSPGEIWDSRSTRLIYLQVKRDGVVTPRERLDLTREAKKAGAEAYVVAPDGRAKYRVREVSDWHMSDWQDLADVF